MANRRLVGALAGLLGLLGVMTPVGAQSAPPKTVALPGERPVAPAGWAAPAGSVPIVETVSLGTGPAPSEGTPPAFGLAAATAPATPAATPDGRAVVGRAAGLAPFALAGVSTTGNVAAVHVGLRVRSTDGTWSAWHELDGDEATDGGRTGTEPLWVGRADGYELAVDGAAPADLRLHLVRLDPGAAPAAATSLSGTALSLSAAGTSASALATADAAASGALGPAASSAASQQPLSAGRQPPPAIVGRAGWGARAVDGVDVAKEVRAAVVHHTADGAPYGYGPDEVPGILRAIQAYHQDALGWWDIGYNFVVDRFGRIWEARTGGASKAVIGAHAGGFNTATVGVAVLGDFRGVGVDPTIFEALTQVIAWKLFLSGADPARNTVLVARPGGDRFAPGALVPLPRIVGHSDLNATSCPAGIANHLGDLRAAVQARYAGFAGGADLAATATPGSPPGANALGGDFNGDGRSDVLWDTVDDDRVIWFGQPDGSTMPMPIEADRQLEPLVGDFDGEGTSDVFWYGAGRAAAWYETVTGWPRLVAQPAAPHPRGTAFDGDGDGDDDIVWYDPDSGQTTTWLSLGPAGFRAVRSAAVPPGAEALSLDPDGDGRDDLLWYATGAEVHDLWRSTGDLAAMPNMPVSLPGGRTAAVGDFDGDDSDDLVLTGPTGTTVAWLGLTAQSELPAGGDLTPVGGDISGGGPDELLLVDEAAGSMLRFIGSADRGLGPAALASPAGLRPLMGDVNGDARADVRWVGPTGATELWLAS